MSLSDSVNIAISFLGKEVFSKFEIIYQKVDDSCFGVITKNNKRIEIQYDSLSNLFRALTLIKERKDETSFKISFKKHFQTSGLMLDCSRNGVMKSEKVKEMIVLSALMGHNRLLLYTEDTYKLEQYPYFGYFRGGYTKKEIKEFVEYGEMFGVELVPCIQTLGHMYQALKWQPMCHLKDGSDTLLVDSPDTYKFIDDMIAFCRECFKSNDIHIGMDESTQMGLFRYLQKNGYKDRVEMFSRHLSKVINICKKYDFSPMIWSDMFFRLNSKNEEYYRNTPLPESTLRLIPNGVKLVYWDYYHEDEKTYLDMIRFHKQVLNQVIFGGGSWRWKGYAPSIEISLKYTKSALDACLEERVDDVFITAWGDDGNECSFFTVLPVLAQTSIYNYYGTYDEGLIDSLLKALTSDSLKDFLLMDLPDKPSKKLVAPAYNPSKFLLYQDPLLGIFDSQVKDCFSSNYLEFAQELRGKAKDSKLFGYVYELLSNLCDLLSYKVDLGIRIRKAYKSNDKKMLHCLLADIGQCLIKLDIFHESVKKQWMTECKIYGFEVLDGRLGFLKNRLLSTKDRINEFLNGKIDTIEELEQDVLPFDGNDCEIQWNYWIRNVSPSN